MESRSREGVSIVLAIRQPGSPDSSRAVGPRLCAPLFRRVCLCSAPYEVVMMGTPATCCGAGLYTRYMVNDLARRLLQAFRKKSQGNSLGQPGLNLL